MLRKRLLALDEPPPTPPPLSPQTADLPQLVTDSALMEVTNNQPTVQLTPDAKRAVEVNS